MAQALQHHQTTQCFGLPPSGSGSHRANGPKTGHALTFKLGLSMGAGQWAVVGNNPSYVKSNRNPVKNGILHDAKAFVRKLSAKTGKQYRLLSEAERE